jgi:hypothetical protein
MKILYLLLFIQTTTFAQLRIERYSFDSLLARGKAEFAKEFDQQNYSKAIVELKEAILIEPENAEAHYFLGYAYSRLNAKDGEGMIHMKADLTQRSSAEFELVNRLTPKYTGEIVVLDPYSKLTAEWGSLAMNYWNNNQPDSALWAFKEGRRRGGFPDFFLSVNRYILSHCSKQAILMSSGDNMTIPLWYLQQVEGYRKDVAVVDITLLNTQWYPKLLKSKNKILFDMPQSTIDTLGYTYWKDSTVWMRNRYAYKKFFWTIKPSVQDKYLQRGERLFLSLLQANEFEQEVYFTIGFAPKDQLNLSDLLFEMILLNKINANDQKPYDAETYIKEMTVVLKMLDEVNHNSRDQVAFVDAIRNDLLIHLQENQQAGNKVVVKQLFKLLDAYIPEKVFPYSSKETKKYVDHVRRQY